MKGLTSSQLIFCWESGKSFNGEVGESLPGSYNTMRPSEFNTRECVTLENRLIQLQVAKSIGPRILSLRFHHGDNLLAVLPQFVTQRPDGKTYHFYGGHRLWLSPEDPILSYALDDGDVEVLQMNGGLLVRKPVEPETGIEKSILIELATEEARLNLTHTLTNRNSDTVDCGPWAITQFQTGGVAILPQSRTQAGLLPNRLLALWPYTDISDQHLTLGNDLILLHADVQMPFKIGFPNPRGWLAYCLDGVLFVKRATFDPQGKYTDFGSSSECYCNRQFLELETLAPIQRIAPGETVSHMETWELYSGNALPQDEKSAQEIVQDIGLE